jgi:hypothetical protein
MADETVDDRTQCDLREFRVTVGGKPYIVWVSKTSEHAWTAVAEYDGQWIEATGISDLRAIAGWQQRAESANHIVRS